jgi:hypothetical protein
MVNTSSHMKYTTTFLFLLIFSSSFAQKTATVESFDMMWNFDNGSASYIYDFKQSAQNEIQMALFGKMQEPNYSQVIMNGLLIVSASDKKDANVSIDSIKMKSSTFDSLGVIVDSNSFKLPALLAGQMNRNGDFKPKSAQALFKFLIPIARDRLHLNQPFLMPIDVPFNAYGTNIVSKGYNTLTYIGDTIISGENCAIITGIISITEFDPPKINATIINSTTGKAVYYYNYTNHHYMGGFIEFSMHALYDNQNDDDTERRGSYSNMVQKSRIEFSLTTER